jgi:hypothetical protein
MNIDGKKRFIVTLLADSILGSVLLLLITLQLLGRVSYTDISGILTSSVMGIVGITGGYLGVQTISDNKKLAGGQN